MIYELNGIFITQDLASDNTQIQTQTQTQYYRLLLYANQFIITYDNDNNLNALNTTLMIDNFSNSLEHLLEDVISRVSGNLKNALTKQAAITKHTAINDILSMTDRSTSEIQELNILDKNYIAAFMPSPDSFIPIFINNFMNIPADIDTIEHIADVADIADNTNATVENKIFSKFINEDATQYPDTTSEDLSPDVNHLIQQAIIRSNLIVLRSVITQIEKAVL